MAQIQLPIFPAGSTSITSVLAFSRQDEQVTYFNGSMPVFAHDVDDTASFRMITAQFCVNGNTKQADIVRAFGVTSISMKRAVKLYRKQGAKGFYVQRKSRGPAVLTPLVLGEAQQLLDGGMETPEVADQLGVKRDTLSKAVRAGRLHKPLKKECSGLSSKSDRSSIDSVATMGMGAINVEGRVAASIGTLENPISPDFQPALDVPNCGVLCAVPALLALGLLKTTKQFFELPKGYYGLKSLFLLLAFMALARLKSIESLRYCAPGEWGKLLGLDRVPEVRTLRQKILLLSEDDRPEQWSSELCKEWMQAAPEHAGTLYIDGHVRVYNGHQTKLPRHHVARLKLCLRATCDYWVNAMDGQPFFVVHQAVDPGMIKVIEQDILPRLQRDVPNQPDDVALAANPLLHRLMMVFDREGYSPDFFKRMKKKRIACMTYHKYPGENWPEVEFQSCTVKMPTGEMTSMKLAERGSRLNNKLWVREIRKLTKRGHQTAIISTDYVSKAASLAIAMFSRWSQENFFKYLKEHYSLDRLVDYRTEAISDPVEVVNPAYRQLDGQVRSCTGKLTRQMALFGAISMEETIDPKPTESFMQRKAAMQEDIEQLQNECQEFKEKRKQTARHITVAELPEAERFEQLSTPSKHLIDTIKMIAYRAETAMANQLRENISRPDEARTLLRELNTSDADLLPDHKEGTLTVRIHHMANRCSDTAIGKLCEELNATKTTFPGTDLCLIFKLGSN